MAKKPQDIDFEAEFKERLNKLRESVWQAVPLSRHYGHFVRGAKPILVSIGGDLASLQFPNGTVTTKVSIRYFAMIPGTSVVSEEPRKTPNSWLARKNLNSLRFG